MKIIASGIVMREWKNLIGMIIVTFAVIICGILISNAIKDAGLNIQVGLEYMGELIKWLLPYFEFYL